MDLGAAWNYVLNDQLLIYAFPVFILFLALEFYYDKREQSQLYSTADLWRSLGLGILSLLAELLPKILFFAIFFTIYKADVFGLNAFMQRNTWWVWLVLILADDFSYYWFHRFNHEVRFFWAGHVPHHSSQYYNLGTALRQGVGERLYKYCYYLWLPLLGLDPVMIFMMMSIGLIYQYWIHTETIRRLPTWFAYVFNTPSHHRVHHATQLRYLDKNHGGIFIIWDRIFGTFQAELDSDKPIYGLTTNVTDQHLMHLATHEYRAIWRDLKSTNRWSDRWKYMFYAPGWTHQGIDQRTKTLREQAREEITSV